MAESYQDKLDNFSRGKSFLKLRGGVRNSTSEPCGACGSGQPGTLFGIRELLTGLDHFVGYNCLRELMRKKAVLQGRVRETTEEAFSRAQKSSNGQFGQGHNGKPAGETNTQPHPAEGKTASSVLTLAEGTSPALPLDVPAIVTPGPLPPGSGAIPRPKSYLPFMNATETVDPSTIPTFPARKSF